METYVQGNLQLLGNYLGKGIIIFISGKAGSGKSSTAQAFQNILTADGYTAMFSPMAKPVKQAARDCFGWDDKKDSKGRKLLQMIGNTGREYNPDIWVQKSLEDTLDACVFEPDFILIDDWRFPNEVKWARDFLFASYNIYTVKVVAPDRESLKGTEFYNDISETSLDDYKDFDFVIDNSGSIQDLIKSVGSVCDQIFGRMN